MLIVVHWVYTFIETAIKKVFERRFHAFEDLISLC